jgi:hypothetical protein
VSTSSKEPQALTKKQFGVLLVVLALCAVAAVVSMASMGDKHGVCPTDTQVSRPANASCWVTYQNLEQTGVIGYQPAS